MFAKVSNLGHVNWMNTEIQPPQKDSVSEPLIQTKCWVYGNSDFKLQERQISICLQNHQVLVRPKFVGICGSDLTMLETYKGSNLIFGHEWVGTVVAVGSSVTDLRPGDVVTSGAFFGCGECEMCKSDKPIQCEHFFSLSSDLAGALSTAMILPQQFLVKIEAQGVSLSSMVLFEILAVAVRTFIDNENHLQEFILNKQEIAIFGAGPLGLSCALEAKRRGLTPVVIDPIADRVARAKGMGFESIHLGVALLNNNLYQRFKICVDASGNHLNSRGALKILSQFLSPNAYAIMLAKYHGQLNIDFSKLIELCPTLRWFRGCDGFSLRETIRIYGPSIEEVAKRMISHQFKFADTPAAFEVAKARSQTCKVLIEL